MTRHKRVIIIGGGIVGCSLLYHLALEGWADCLLLEKAELTSGSTWHAAGAITHSIASYANARMAGYGIELYQRLEAETGQSVTWHGCGSLRLAYTNDELDYLRYIASVGATLGHPMEIIGPAAIGRLHPLYSLEGVIAALHTPADGHVDPAGATFALAKGARQRGAEIARFNRATDVRMAPDGAWRIATEQGDFDCDMVVNAGGSYARQIGQWVGLDLPVVSAAHQYLITEDIPALKALPRELPLVRDNHGMSAYFRQERHSILMGFYEKEKPHLVYTEGAPWESANELFEPDLDAIMPSLETAIARMPILGEIGIRKTINGAIMYTPDGAMLLGPAPGLRNYWCACGVSVGVAWGPGVGKYLAQLMVHGAADINMRAFDPRRFGGWAHRGYTIEKVREDYVLRHQVAFPARDRPAARPVRASAIYESLKRDGAVYEQLFGWERPAWFAKNGVEQRHHESFRRSAAHTMIAREALAVRDRAGLLDLSGFGKVEVTGRDAAALLDRLSTNRLPSRDGAVTLTYLLNPTGTFEAELTCTRLNEERYLLLFAALDEIRVLDRLVEAKRQREDVRIENMSDAIGSLVLAGPAARPILSAATNDDVSNDAIPWLRSAEITVAGCRVRALRVSLVGELSYEIHVPMARLKDVHEALYDAGEPFGVEHFGVAALNAMRIEKAHKGTRELNATSTPVETGAMRFVRMDKGDFVGRAALARKLEEKPFWRCAYLAINAGDADAHGSEAVLHHGRPIGSVSSGAFGPRVGRSLGFAFIPADIADNDEQLSVQILGEERPARILVAPAYDPGNQRLRG